MSKKKYTVIKELDPDTVEGFTDAQRENYKNLGYLPFLLSNGKTKWLTASQKVTKDSGRRSFFTQDKPRPKNRKSRRHKRRRSSFRGFILDNWMFFALVLLVAATLYVVLKHWNQFFG